MTRLRNLAIGGLAALAMAGVTSGAFAESPVDFQNRLQGATIGLPLGALPPPGIYTGLETAYLGVANFGHGGGTTGNWSTPFGGVSTGLPAVAQAVPLLYVPGWNFLGASYAMSAVQAFYVFTTCSIPLTCNNIVSGGFVYANTTWNPVTLSWKLPGGWFASLGFNFMAPDGSRYHGAGIVDPNPDFWTLEPTFAFAWLTHNFTLAANFFYDVNLQSPGNCCLLGVTGLGPTGVRYNNGNLFYGDLTALAKFGKWSIGPVAYFEVQTTADSLSGPLNCATAAVALAGPVCANFSNVGIGGLVGYDFGPVDIQVWVTDAVQAANSPVGTGSIFVWSRLGFRLWGPEAHPLVAKN